MATDDFDPPFPVDWQVGDRVFARYYDPATGKYVARLEGLIVRIEGGELVLATEIGEKRRSAKAWPAWKTPEAAEASLAKKPGPYDDSRPMAHYGADTSPAKPRQQRDD
jgi:hypothetical protein